MSIITEYQSRTLDQEPDTIAFIPQYPDYIIVGTYHLNKPKEDGQNHDESAIPLRGGSLQIFPFDISSGNQGPTLPIAHKDFSCAIVDLQFHPGDGSLLGVATSTGELRFFRVIQDETSASAASHPIFDILEIGIAKISENEDSESLPLVTYFDWLPNDSLVDGNGLKVSKMVTIIACDTMGDTKLVRVQLPVLDDVPGSRDRDEKPLSTLSADVEPIHKQQHDLEAWYVTGIQLQQTDPDYTSHLVLSGGDDGCLLATTCNVSSTGDMLATPPYRQFNMRKEHDAGVVSILALNGVESNLTPILTGSYDDHLRLFLFHPPLLPKPPVLTTSINLGGGVWRVLLLDQYTTPGTEDKHWILLVCAMYDGAKIVRLTASPLSDDSDGTPQIATRYDWNFQVEAVFKNGHTSMVYAAIARQTEQEGLWKILTTSFYDRKMCGWSWEDTKKRNLPPAEPLG